MARLALKIIKLFCKLELYIYKKFDKIICRHGHEKNNNFLNVKNNKLRKRGKSFSSL